MEGLTINMKIVITGSSGFIAKNLIVNLKNKKNIELVLLTRNSNSAFFTDYSINSLVKLIEGADCIIHLAAKRFTQSSFAEVSKNAFLTERIIDAGIICNVSKIINISSISVYSDQHVLPWKETQVVKPKNYYGLSKYTSEEISRLMIGKASTILYNLRLAHVFGANEQNNYMINLFLRQAHLGKTLNVNAVQGKREFIYVRDITSAIEACIFDTSNDAALTLNIGSGESLSNLEVANIISNVFGVSEPIILNQLPDKTQDSSYMDSSLALEKIGFKSKYSFKEAIEEIRLSMGDLENVQEFV